MLEENSKGSCIYCEGEIPVSEIICKYCLKDLEKEEQEKKIWDLD